MKPSDLSKYLSKANSDFTKGDSGSTLLGHSACPRCQLNGKDRRGNNLANYRNLDGSESSFCFSCQYTKRSTQNMTSVAEAIVPEEVALHQNNGFDQQDYNPSKVKPTRGVTPVTLSKYGVHVDDSKHMYPYYNKENLSELVGLKVRKLEHKDFYALGTIKRDSSLFGQHVFSKGTYKDCIITEGELDALSAYQMMSGRVPCLSIPTGADGAAKAIQANWDYLKRFTTVYLCLDNDEPGKKATEAIAKMFPTGQVKVINLSSDCKDANDALNTLEGPSLFNRSFNNAKVWTPENIVCSSDMFELISTDDNKESVPYPWAGLNEITYGIRPGELVTFCAGSGQGKSQFLREIAYHLLKNTQANVGMMFLEESIKKTAKGLLSIELSKPLHVPDAKVKPEEVKGAFERLLQGGRVFFFDHFGSSDIDSIIAYVHYLAMVANCKYIFLDHVSIIVSGQDNGDERKALDEVMTKLRTVVEKTGITLFLVSHLKRIGEGHENGEEVSLSHLRGSAGIAQISDFVIGLERNSQDPDPVRRNTTLIRVLKNRVFGLTGVTAAVEFKRDTWRLTEVDLESYLNKGKKKHEDDNKSTKESELGLSTSFRAR